MLTRFFDYRTITQAAQLLCTGELIAFPTETVYGLGADATNSDAVSAIFKAKGRPSDNPLIVHIANISQISLATNEWSSIKQKLAQRFWPGPLTIISHRNPGLSPLVSAGLETVGIRIPAHPLALEFLDLIGRPVAAPSANLSGRPSPTTYQMVKHDLSGKISGILRIPEKLSYGIESTVISLDEEKKILFLLREGCTTKEDLMEVLPNFKIQEGSEEKNRTSPGVHYTHYKPSVPVKLYPFENLLNLSKFSFSGVIGMLIWVNSEKMETSLLREGWKREKTLSLSIKIFQKEKNTLFLICFKTLRSYAKGYYESLFYLEQMNCSLILAQDCPEKWIGRALKNRLIKSSSGEFF